MKPLERTEKRKPTTVNGEPTTRRAALMENMEKPEQAQSRSREMPRETLRKWGTVDRPLCECGTPESRTHLTQCPLRTAVTTSNLCCANAKAIQLAQEIENFI